MKRFQAFCSFFVSGGLRLTSQGIVRLRFVFVSVTLLKVILSLKKTEYENGFETSLFYQENRNKSGPIMGRINIGKTVAQFSTKLKVPVSLWDTRTNRVSGKSNYAVQVNQELDRISLSVNSHYSRLSGLKESATATEVKNAFQGIASAQETIIDYFARHNEEFNKRIGINREKSTAIQYENSLNHLVRFIRKKYNVSDIPFSKLDFSFIEAYDFYLRIELKMMPNTILGITCHLLKMIRLAISEGIISHNPFESYTPERSKAKQKYLTWEELDRIMTTQLDHPARYLTRDMFLFSVFTGLAFRDICNLTPKHIVKVDGGVLWIKTTRQKTGTPSEVPLLDLPKQIIEKYQGIAKDGKLLPMLSCGRLNKNLKVIAKLCNIDRTLIYHKGRHNFGTLITLSKGVSLETVSQMMGHKCFRTTQIYAKLTRQKIIRYCWMSITGKGLR